MNWFFFSPHTMLLSEFFPPLGHGSWAPENNPRVDNVQKRGITLTSKKSGFCKIELCPNSNSKIMSNKIKKRGWLYLVGLAPLKVIFNDPSIGRRIGGCRDEKGSCQENKGTSPSFRFFGFGNSGLTFDQWQLVARGCNRGHGSDLPIELGACCTRYGIATGQYARVHASHVWMDARFVRVKWTYFARPKLRGLLLLVLVLFFLWLGAMDDVEWWDDGCNLRLWWACG